MRVKPMQTQRASEIKSQPKKLAKISPKVAAKEKVNPLLAMIGAGKGHSSYGSAEEVVAYIRAERDQWD